MKKQRILSALLTLCLVFSLVPTALAADADKFTDISKDSWCYEYVDYVTSKGYFRGTTETTFSPDRSMTRAMFVVVLSRFDGAKVDNSQSAFTDVAPGAWCAGAINWAAAKKIVEGKGDGTFAPNEPITRAQMCAIMQRYLNYYAKKHNVTAVVKSAATSLTDRGQIPAYARTAVEQCQKWGLVNGFSDGTFRPQAMSSRAQVAAVIYRLAFVVKNAKPASSGGSSGGGGGGGSEPDPTYNYKLTYNANGGTFATDPSETVANVTAISKTFTVTSVVPTRDGYTFLGWADEATDTAADYVAGDTITLTSSDNEKTLYAVWQENPATYTYKLIYNANGGTFATDPSETVANVTDTSYTFTVTSVEPTRDGFVFIGWANGNKATVADYVAGEEITLTSSDNEKTLYAVWVSPDDLLGNAVINSVNTVNEKYETLKNAVVEAVEEVNDANGYLTSAQLQKVKDVINDVVAVEPVTVNFTSGDTVTDREVSLTVSAAMNDGQIVSAINKASELAETILNGEVSQPTGEDVQGFLSSVKTAVEDQTGIILTEKTLGEIKEQVLNKLKTEGKSLWANFHDGAGTYYFSSADVDLNNTTYATVVVGQNGPSVPGDKVQMAKNLSVAMSKDIYGQAKAQGDSAYTSAMDLSAGIELGFAPSSDAETAAKTSPFPSDYRVVLNVELDSNGVVEYKYDAGNYIRVNISQDVQDAYNEAVNSIAARFTWNNDAVKTQVVDKVKDVLESQIDTIISEVEGQLASYGITLTYTTAESLKAALLPEVEGWVATNWDTIVSSLGTHGLAGMDNTALIDAAWPLLEQDINAVDVDALLQSKLAEQLDDAGIDEAWLVDKANNMPLLAEYRGMLDGYEVTYDPAEFSLEINSVDDVNAMMGYDTITASANRGGFAFTVTIKGENDTGFGITLKRYIVELATDALNDALAGSETLSEMVDANPGLADYLLYSALVKLGLDFDDEKADARDEAIFASLKETIKTEGHDKLVEKLNGKIASIDVDSYLEADAEGAADVAEKVALLNGLKFPAIQSKTASGLADALKSAALAEIIGTRGDATVDKYLDRVINKAMSVLPASGSITINGVTLDRDTLAGLAEADTTVEAVHAVADIIDQFGDLSLNTFDTEDGVAMTVAFRGRTATVHLVIDVK